MRTFSTFTGLVLLAASATAFAQTEAVCGNTLDAPLQPNSTLTIDSTPAGLEVVPSDDGTVHVTCHADDSDQMAAIRMRITGPADRPHLGVSSRSLHHNNLKIRVMVPVRTNLHITMGAGQVTIGKVEGDKDISLSAGQITITSPHAWNYRDVDVSVMIGQVNAAAYGANKGGFFRSVTRSNSGGEFYLRAHVLTGQIELLEGSAKTMGD